MTDLIDEGTAHLLHGIEILERAEEVIGELFGKLAADVRQVIDAVEAELGCRLVDAAVKERDRVRRDAAPTCPICDVKCYVSSRIDVGIVPWRQTVVGAYRCPNDLREDHQR